MAKKLLSCQTRRAGRVKLKKGWTYARGGGCKKAAGGAKRKGKRLSKASKAAWANEFYPKRDTSPADVSHLALDGARRRRRRR